MAFRKEYPRISVVIPLFNEAGCARTNVTLVQDYLETLNMAYELVLVNDGSTDSTRAICDGLVNQSPSARLISYPVNRGKGYAVRRGVLSATGKYVIFTDADLAVPIHFIDVFLKRLETGIPIVIGSRHLPESSFIIREGALRQCLGEAFRRFTQTALGLKVSDITCGFKGFNKEIAFNIFSRSMIDRWGYDAEIIFLAQQLGYRINEIPVEWYHSLDSKVCIGIDSVRTLAEICRVYYYFLSRQYKC